MSHTSVSPNPPGCFESGCFRLTPRGQSWVAMTRTQQQLAGALSRYLHDVLMLCGSGVWLGQLRQFVPPRSLDDTLEALLALGLVERLDAADCPQYAAPALARSRNMTAPGRMAAR